MAIYGVIVAVITMLAWLYSNSKKNIKLLILVLMIVLASSLSGLRGVGTDYVVHKQHFNEIISGDYFYADYSSLLIKFMRCMGELDISFQTIMFLVAVITISSVFISLALFCNEISFSFAVFSYMTSFYLYSFNLYRQMLAASILLLAVSIWIKWKRVFLPLFLTLIAAGIHNTAIPFIMIYPLWKFISEKKYIVLRVIFYTVCILAIFTLPIIFQKYYEYLSALLPHYEYYFRNFVFNGIGFGLLRYMFIAVIPAAYCCLTNKIKNRSEVGFLPVFAICGTILWCLSYISDTFMYRISFYFLIFLPFLHGWLLKNSVSLYRYNVIGLKKISIIIPVISLILMFFLFYDIKILNTGEVVPYCFFWE